MAMGANSSRRSVVGLESREHRTGEDVGTGRDG